MRGHTARVNSWHRWKMYVVLRTGQHGKTREPSCALRWYRMGFAGRQYPCVRACIVDNREDIR